LAEAEQVVCCLDGCWRHGRNVTLGRIHRGEDGARVSTGHQQHREGVDIRRRCWCPTCSPTKTFIRGGVGTWRPTPVLVARFDGCCQRACSERCDYHRDRRVIERATAELACAIVAPAGGGPRVGEAARVLAARGEGCETQSPGDGGRNRAVQGGAGAELAVRVVAPAVAGSPVGEPASITTIGIAGRVVNAARGEDSEAQASGDGDRGCATTVIDVAHVGCTAPVPELADAIVAPAV